ncbi:MAG TPA: protein kinase, partial [Thermoanaerobaculia bacterium]|nr:protein kinase [Thermoanaerobaculia bacterium]
IVHRDLKPANVKITPQGKVKVLDFGLAKAIAGDPSSPDATQSPTITAAATQAGVVIGTAAYMSPEQARGRAVDRRSDIWAFGAVVYEMLTGKKAFEGETISDTLAAVLRAEVDWSALPPETPQSVRRVLKRCVDRDLKTRFHDVADARIAMDETPEAPAAVAATPPVSRNRSVLWPSVAAALLLLAGAGWWRALHSRPAGTTTPISFAVTLSGADRIPFDDMPVLDLSRDGTRLVFVGESEGHRRLYLRTRDRIEPRAIEGTDSASSPFFSPDGEWLGFFADGKLKKVSADGGVAMVLADAPNNRGGVWLADDSIVFAPDFTSGLSRVPARGGKSEVLTTPDAAGGERTHRWPTYVPGDDGAVLFTIGMLKGPGDYDDARIALWDPASRKVRVVFEGGSMARFAPPNHLVYMRAETLLVVPFDAKTRRVTGDAVGVNEKVSVDASSGVAYVAFASDGTFASVASAGGVDARSIVLTDRAGKPRSVSVPARPYHYPRFSPDGKRVAVTIGPGHGHSDDVWTIDLETGALTRLTIGEAKVGNYYPVWSNDGRRIAYSSDRAHQGIWFKSADGTGAEEALEPEAQPDLPADWSRDGSTLAITKNFPSTDVYLTSLADRKQTLFEPGASCPVFSPDGKWLAYVILAPGNPAQILVKPVAGEGGKVQITSDRGSFPVWTDRGLYFMADRRVFAVDVQTQPVFKAGPAQQLFEVSYDRGTVPSRNFDVTRDGQTFVFVTGAVSGELRQINVALGWTPELGRLTAPAR